tara:strand:+ start:173 stop:1030 length:858 start_codon:yes stop_codon:yes gene_type:complete
MLNKTKRLCASCLKLNFKKTLKVNNKHHPKWLDKINYVEKFVNNYNSFKIKSPENYTNKLTFHISKKFAHRKILYWGASPNTNLIINDAKTAYNNFSNSGVAIIDKNGYVNIKFLMPQNYKTIMKNYKNSRSFFRHIHFVISNRDNNSWNKQIYTKLVHNNYNYSNFMNLLNSKKAIVLNVLPCHIYAKEHIPNTYNLPFKNIKNMTTQEINKWLQNLIELHYPILKKLLDSKKIEYYEIPIICYCAHNKCSASKIGCENLMKKGFINVSLYEDGMKGYKENSKL